MKDTKVLTNESENPICRDVFITDDVNRGEVKKFTITLNEDYPSLDNRISLSQTPATVLVTDKDGKIHQYTLHVYFSH